MGKELERGKAGGEGPSCCRRRDPLRRSTVSCLRQVNFVRRSQLKCKLPFAHLHQHFYFKLEPVFKLYIHRFKY